MQVEKAIRKLLKQAPQHVIKPLVINPNMCDCVKDALEDLVDDLWPEIEEEIIYFLRYYIYIIYHSIYIYFHLFILQCPLILSIYLFSDLCFYMHLCICVLR